MDYFYFHWTVIIFSKRRLVAEEYVTFNSQLKLGCANVQDAGWGMLLGFFL